MVLLGIFNRWFYSRIRLPNPNSYSYSCHLPNWPNAELSYLDMSWQHKFAHGPQGIVPEPVCLPIARGASTTLSADALGKICVTQSSTVHCGVKFAVETLLFARTNKLSNTGETGAHRSALPLQIDSRGRAENAAETPKHCGAAAAPCALQCQAPPPLTCTFPFWASRCV